MMPKNARPGYLQANSKVQKPNHPTGLLSAPGTIRQKVAEIAKSIGILRTQAEAQPTYVRDTMDFLKKLKQAEHRLKDVKGKSAWLFCMDLQKLYPSVPQSEGLQACETALNHRGTTGTALSPPFPLETSWI